MRIGPLHADDMRFMVELPDEDEEPLRTLALMDVRSFKQHGGYLLHLKIREEFAKLVAARREESVAEQVA